MMGAVDHLIRIAMVICVMTLGGVAVGYAMKALTSGVLG